MDRLKSMVTNDQQHPILDDLRCVCQKMNPMINEEPLLLECNVCKYRCTTSSRLIGARLELARMLINCDDTNDQILMDIARQCIIVAENPNDINNNILKLMIGRYIGNPPRLASTSRNQNAERFALGLLQSEVLVHHWAHSYSCFKHHSGKEKCRFNFPRLPQHQSGFIMEDDSLLWIPYKGTGSEYINVHNPLITKIFKSNNDIRLLSCGGSANAVRYCIGYVTKRDSNSSIIDMLGSFDRQQAKIDDEKKKQQQHPEQQKPNPKEEAIKQGRRIVTSMLLTSTSHTQIPLTEAALYIINGSMAYRSHKFTSIPLEQIIAFLSRLEYKEMVIAGDKHVPLKISSWIYKYTHRSDDVENLCPYEYAEQGCNDKMALEHSKSDDEKD